MESLAEHRRGAFAYLARFASCVDLEPIQIFRHVLKVIAVLLFSAASMPGQAASSFTVRLADQSGSPLRNAAVTIEGPSGTRIELITDGEGYIGVPGLPEGRYRIRVTTRFFEIMERDVQIGRNHAGRPTLDGQDATSHIPEIRLRCEPQAPANTAPP